MEQLPITGAKEDRTYCASSIALPAPGVGLPKPLENEEEQPCLDPLKLMIKFLLAFPIESKKR